MISVGNDICLPHDLVSFLQPSIELISSNILICCMQIYIMKNIALLIQDLNYLLKDTFLCLQSDIFDMHIWEFVRSNYQQGIKQEMPSILTIAEAATPTEKNL